MSLESTLTKLVAAIEANTAAIAASNTQGPANTTAESPKPKSAPKKSAPEPTPEPEAKATETPAVDKKALTAIVIKVAKTKGREAASQLLSAHGATKVPELDVESYDAVFAEAEALLA